jgi:hypothetical protein
MLALVAITGLTMYLLGIGSIVLMGNLLGWWA